MGTNRRYAEAMDRRAIEAEITRTAVHGPLQTLTDAELDLRTVLVTIDPRPGKVRAWVRFGAEPLHVTAEAGSSPAASVRR